ncbi:MAG: CRISPR-associated protein Cas4 [Clostridia bacterium]|nr:CRISPR-associated protein Cas4 [Clostridia bacterium]
MTQREPLLLSGIQHFAYCRRQWALIHIEGQWAENLRTVGGQLLHRRAHDEKEVELRGDILTVRGLRIASARLNITGVCDVVEFHRCKDGISLAGWDGGWMPYPVEYKRGAPKEHNADRLQLCAQAMCLEEMLMCGICEGSLFYGETRRRERVELTHELRSEVEAMTEEMTALMQRGHTPSVRPTKGCNACSLKEVCLPALKRAPSVEAYIRSHLEDNL